MIPLTLLAGAGLLLIWDAKRRLMLYALPLLFFPIPYYLTHADVRFGYVLYPLLIVLAANAVIFGLDWLSPKQSAQASQVAG